MYEPVWSPSQEEFPEEIQETVSHIEQQLINEDGQLEVEEADDGYSITLTVFNESRTQSTDVFKDFEQMIQLKHGLDYTFKATQKEATAELHGLE